MSKTLTVSYQGNTLKTLTDKGSFKLNTNGTIATENIAVTWAWEGEDEPIIETIGTLEETTWEKIGEKAQLGNAGNYWAIGDTKSVVLNGTMGTYTFSNKTYYVYVIGINHQGVNGITFQGFKTAASNGTKIGLTDSYYASTDTNGSKYFSMSHRGNYNYGGWKCCDARYDILGSTNVPSSTYGSTNSTSRVGYDATSAATSSPVANTLMSCLPSDLRSVMQPMTIYTDNVGNKSTSSSSVTASIDYLPLLSNYEVFANTTSTNPYEANYQEQYEYYTNGNPALTYYMNENTATAAETYLRSPYTSSTAGFKIISTSGTSGSRGAVSSRCISPMFRV